MRYATLREAHLPAALLEDTGTWRLIVAADVLCYFGELHEMFGAVRERLKPGGRFIFSVEELLPDHDGNIPGNGDWALEVWLARQAARTCFHSAFPSAFPWRDCTA